MTLSMVYGASWRRTQFSDYGCCPGEVQRLFSAVFTRRLVHSGLGGTTSGNRVQGRNFANDTARYGRLAVRPRPMPQIGPQVV